MCGWSRFYLYMADETHSEDTASYMCLNGKENNITKGDSVKFHH